MTLIHEFVEKAKKSPMRIVFPEGNDPRIIEAAAKAKAMGIANSIILGDEAIIQGIASDAGVSLEGVQIVSSADESLLGRLSDAYAKARNVKKSITNKIACRPLLFCGMMVKTGEADGMVAGVNSTTSSVIQAASLTIGFQNGISKPSSIFIMIIPEFLGEKDKIFIFTDCAVNVSPNAEELAEIGVLAGRNAYALLNMKPKIAFLSFSTKGSARHSGVDKIVNAAKIAKKMAPDYAIDGELQVDAAIMPTIAAGKAKESRLEGTANILVFPDLNAGNMAYKLVQYMAHATALGPIMQGFAKPVNDMSRGASVEDVIGVTAITSIQAQNLKEKAFAG